jgi:hypothetical protein
MRRAAMAENGGGLLFGHERRRSDVRHRWLIPKLKLRLRDVAIRTDAVTVQSMHYQGGLIGQGSPAEG